MASASVRNERGSAIALVAVALTALLSMIALAIDLGMLFTARGEAQRVADAASLAGAASFIEAPDNPDRAEDLAIQYAARNTVRNETVVLLPEDVEVDADIFQVRVTVRRTAGRGSAIATWFARVFGVNAVDVAAVATAEAAPAGAAVCVKPFTVPDAWDDANDNGQYDPGELYDPLVTGYGTDYRNGIPADNGIDPVGTTYENDFGRPMALKEGTPQEAIVPSWYFPWDVPDVSDAPIVGADRYRWNIANCNTNVIGVGQQYQVETGNMRGPTRQGIEDLIDLDPGAHWDVTADSVVGSAYQPWKASPRFVHLPLFDPTEPIDPGKKPIVFNNMTAFFVEEMDGDDVIGRFLYASGIAGGNLPGGGQSIGPLIKFVRLVE
jgi:hypothetical protein